MNKGNHIWSIGLLLALFSLMYLLPLQVRPMMRPDEFRYAEIPREMMARHEYVIPRFNGVRYYEKPVLGYHLTALSFKVFGLNRFALRFPPAMAVLASALFLYFLMHRFGEDEHLPFVTSAVFMTMGMVCGVGTVGVLDSQLSAALTCCIGLFFLAYDGGVTGGCKRFSRRVVVCLALAGGFAGVAFLLKGLLGFVLPVIVILPFLAWERDWKGILIYPWIPALAALVVIFPWSWMIYRRDPGFWHYFIVVEHFKRFTEGTLDRHPEPFWFYLPMLATIFPGGFLILGAVRGWGRWLFRERLSRYLLCWSVMPFLFFSLSSVKVGTYILPVFAPLACLIAMGAIRNWRQNPERFERGMNLFGTVISWGLFVLGLGLSLAAASLVLIRVPGLEIPQHNRIFLWVTLFAVMLWRSILRRKKTTIQNLFLILTFGFAVFLCSTAYSVPYHELLNDKMPERDIRRAIQETPIPPDVRVFAYRTAFSPVAWVLQRDDIVLTDNTCELQFGFENYPEETKGRFVDSENRLVKEYGGKGRNVFITFRNMKKDPLDPALEASEQVKKGCVVMVWF